MDQIILLCLVSISLLISIIGFIVLLRTLLIIHEDIKSRLIEVKVFLETVLKKVK
jgi:hypothetical protein